MKPPEGASQRAALHWARDRLQHAEVDGAAREARLLLQAASGKTVEQLIADEEEIVKPDAAERLGEFVRRRVAGEPVGRVVGRRLFYGLDLELSEAVLEPRDDTGTLVDLVLAQLEDRAWPRSFADLGTGTGAVALALLSQLSNAAGVATDISADALRVAERNAKAHGLSGRLLLRCGSWLEALDKDSRFDFIVSNPPYIRSDDMASLQAEVRRHDPQIALDGGMDGLEAYRSLANAGAHLKPNGFLAVEMGYDQAEQIGELMEAAGWHVVQVARDLSGRDRAMVLRFGRGR